MFRRIILLIISKIKSIFLPSISFSARVEYSSVSRKSKVWGRSRLFHSTIDDYTYVGRDTWVVHAHLGKFCSVANECVIGMGTHSLNFLSTSSLFTSRHNGTGQVWTKKNSFEEYKEIFIGNDVWIGYRAMVMGGVHIGNGAVIAAGAVVTKDVPPYAIVGGVPAKIIRYRFSQNVIDKLIDIKWWNMSETDLKKKISIFQNPNISIDDLSV